MKHETAKTALAHYENASTELMKCLDVIQTQCPTDEARRYRSAVAQTLATMMGIAEPMHLEHPDLDVHQVTIPYARKLGPRPAVDAPRTAEQKLDLLQSMVRSFPDHERMRGAPNADLYQLVFQQCAAAGELAERLPREKPDTAAVNAERILDLLGVIAGFVVVLSEREGKAGGGETQH